jgi:hypothetical protein
MKAQQLEHDVEDLIVLSPICIPLKEAYTITDGKAFPNFHRIWTSWKLESQANS